MQNIPRRTGKRRKLNSSTMISKQKSSKVTQKFITGQLAVYLVYNNKIVQVNQCQLIIYLLTNLFLLINKIILLNFMPF